jgi:hypothetical protein
MINIRQFFCFGLVLFSAVGAAQSFDKKIGAATLALPDKEVKGFVTSFDFSPENVQLSWWKYAKRFALPQNQRTHYEVTIPATNDSKEVVIYTQLGEETGKPISFKLGLKSDNMSEEERKKYQEQAKALLLDFKRWHYLRHYEEQLEDLEKSVTKTAGTNWDEWMAFVGKRAVIIEMIKGV